MFNASSLSWLRIRVKCAHMWKMYKCMRSHICTTYSVPIYTHNVNQIIINFERRKPVRSINWFQLYSPLNWVMLSRETACSPLSGPVLLVRGGLWRWQPVASGDLISAGALLPVCGTALGPVDGRSVVACNRIKGVTWWGAVGAGRGLAPQPAGLPPPGLGPLPSGLLQTLPATVQLHTQLLYFLNPMRGEGETKW